MKDRIAAEALARFPEEACGLVLGGSVLVVAENVAEDPIQAFKVHPDTVERYWRETTAVWHSHCFGPAMPSEEDERWATQPGIETWIYSVPDEELGIYLPSERGRLRLLRME